jgi:copper transport protein
MRYIVRMAMMIGWLILSGSAAMAHAGLVSSDPVDGAVLKASPEALVLSFTEPVTPLVFTLLSADGARQDLTGAVATDDDVRIGLPTGLIRGTHLITWRAVSADGHPVSGTISFSVGAPGSVPQAGTGGDFLRDGAIWAVRAGLYLLLFGTVGAALFGAIVAPLPPGFARAAGFLALPGIGLAGLALGLQGLDALGLGLAGLLSVAPWVTGFGTSFGGTAIAMAIGFFASFVASRVRRGRQLGLVVLAAGAAALAPMLSGHAGTAPPTWLSKPAVVMHIAGLMFWLGSLLPLLVLLRAGGPEAERGLSRFSRMIPYAVAAIVLSGGVLAVLQLGPPNPAWTSGYGVLLATKFALLLPLFALALANRLWLTRPVLAGKAQARQRLRWLVLSEIVLVALVLVVVAGWRFTPPPRVLAEIAARPAHTHIHTDEAMADVTLTPGHAGEAVLSLWLMDGGLAPLSPKAVTVSLSNKALGIERLERPAKLDADGFWRVPVTLPAGGAWQLGLALRVDDFTMLQLSGELEVNP